MKLKNFIAERYNNIIKEELVVSTEPNTINLWHGGDLSDLESSYKQKSSNQVYGAGLYLITQYEVAIKYAKGSRKLYLVTVEKGNDLNGHLFDVETVKKFISQNLSKPKAKIFYERMAKYVKNNKLSGDIFDNILVNNNLLSPSFTPNLLNFYKENNIDYNSTINAFGWGETMIMLYNLSKIKNIQRVKSNDSIPELSKTWN